MVATTKSMQDSLLRDRAKIDAKIREFKSQGYQIEIDAEAKGINLVYDLTKGDKTKGVQDVVKLVNALERWRSIAVREIF